MSVKRMNSSSQSVGDRYDPVLIRICWLLNRVRASFVKTTWAVRQRLLEMGPRSRADLKTLCEIEEQIPECRCYDQVTVMRQLRSVALKKGYRSLEEYYEAVSTDPDSLSVMRENLTFIGTRFFRGGIWPELRSVCESSFAGKDGGAVRVWCAGCSSGKEVYSILMVLLDILPPERIEMLATDYNAEVLRRCREATYPLVTLGEIPRKYWPYTERVPSSREFRFQDSLRSMVQTGQLNLLTDGYPAGFDLILCRNVVKFFREEVRTDVQRKLARSLNPGGFLVVSDDLEHDGIKDPEASGLRQLDKSCIYVNQP